MISHTAVRVVAIEKADQMLLCPRDEALSQLKLDPGPLPGPASYSPQPRPLLPMTMLPAPLQSHTAPTPALALWGTLLPWSSIAWPIHSKSASHPSLPSDLYLDTSKLPLGNLLWASRMGAPLTYFSHHSLCHTLL